MKKFKKILMIVLILSMILSISVSAKDTTNKDETIYGLLNNDGSIENIYVVNRLYGTNNVYVDYGNYEAIKNLSTNTIPIIEGDKITFIEESSLDGGLYYQGTFKGDLPYKVKIEYFLDDKKIDSNKLGGKKGHIDIKIAITSNLYCLKAIRDGFMAQVMVKLDLDNNKNIQAKLANSVIVGKTMTVNYTVLAGESENFKLSFDSLNFSLEPINITLIKNSISLPKSIVENTNAFDEGFLQLINGYENIESGTSKLSNGVNKLVGGIVNTNEGLKTLVNSNQMILGGLAEFKGGLNQVNLASKTINSGVEKLTNNINDINSGIGGLKEGASILNSSHEQLLLLANSLLDSSDPSVVALAKGVIGEYEGIEQLNNGLSNMSYGVNQYASGLDLFANKYSQFNEGLNQLNSQFNQLNDGIINYFDGTTQISNGIDMLYKNIRDMPSQVQQLNRGQKELLKGLKRVKSEIGTMLDSFKTKDISYVSFVSKKNNPSSVQYILTTKKISYEKENEVEKVESKKLTFFERILNLFKF